MHTTFITFSSETAYIYIYIYSPATLEGGSLNICGKYKLNIFQTCIIRHQCWGRNHQHRGHIAEVSAILSWECFQNSGGIACPRSFSALSTVTEGHQRNVIKTPLRRPSIPATLKLAADRALHQVVSTFEVSYRANLREKRHRRKIQGASAATPDQTRPIAAVTAVGLACPHRPSQPSACMHAVDMDSLLQKSSFKKSSQEKRDTSQLLQTNSAQLAGTVEYTYSISA